MRFNPIRTFFPKFYIRKGMERDKRNHEKRLKAAKSSKERSELESEFYQYTLREWDEWLTTIEDRELIEKAQKAEVYLDEIPFAEYDSDDMHSIKNSHYYWGAFGDKLLDPAVRKQLTQAYRKKRPEYRKERREIIGLWIRGGGVFIGIIGALTGFVAVYNKCGIGN